jgi:signal transduction histidine kinase/FixJ family two-component response regulator
MPEKKQDSVKFYIIPVFSLLVMMIFLGITIYSMTAKALKQQLASKCLGLASSVAAFLEENSGEYRKFTETLDTRSDYYIRTKKVLEAIRSENDGNITFLYTEVRVSDTQMMFVLDGEKEGAADFTPPGETDAITAARRYGYETHTASLGDDFVTTKYGTLISAYAPVFDAGASGTPGAGDFLGLVGVDVSVAQFNAIMYRHVIFIAGTILIIGLMGIVIIKLGIERITADKKNEGKNIFLSNISHEIRTPLNAVLGLLEVEFQEKLPQSTRTNLEKIHDSGTHLLGIITNILDASKIESGKFEIIPAEYEISRLINDSVQMITARIGSKPITFHLEIDEAIPARLTGDELRLRQILNNLLSNAVKYTEEGHITLSVLWQKKEDTRISFTVRDTGRGIDKGNIARLFSAYTQADSSAKRNIQGTGLGLSITKGLAEMMGGTVTVESEYGKGSVFTVTIPQTAAGETPLGHAAAEALRRFQFTENRREYGGSFIRHWMPYGKVLVADDFRTNLDVMTGLLMPYGLRVDTVLSGKEAVELVRAEETRYDLIFMDHMMPEMDGIEAAGIIRKFDSEYARNVPLIILTANAAAENRELFLEKGFNDFISKPIDTKMLDLALNRWIRDKHCVTETLQTDNSNNPEMKL